MSYEEQREHISHQLNTFSGEGFDEGLALEVFRFQAAHNAAYGKYLSLLGIRPEAISTLAEVPFFPIQFFKNHSIKTGKWEEVALFTSSGTTGTATSRHPVADLDFYKKNTERGFGKFYGPPSDYCTLALLPSYLERTGSSLVCMADHFIRLSGHPVSGFFLHNTDDLLRALERAQATARKILLLGVSFALLDLAETHPVPLSGVVVMETGGMKGRRREPTRQELHEALQLAFGVPSIHSEYGMTELFSQAYSQGGGLFRPADTMQVFAREITDPFCPARPGATGALNVMDLANFDTISFIATDDLGRVHADGTFEVLGRLDDSDIRGCNLMV